MIRPQRGFAVDSRLPTDEIGRICEQFAVSELSVFGSVLRDDFSSESDLDFLVSFQNDDCGPWMGKLNDLQFALSRLLDRPVDLVLRSGIEQSRNWVRRKSILDSARVVYGS